MKYSEYLLALGLTMNAVEAYHEIEGCEENVKGEIIYTSNFPSILDIGSQVREENCGMGIGDGMCNNVNSCFDSTC